MSKLHHPFPQRDQKEARPAQPEGEPPSPSARYELWSNRIPLSDRLAAAEQQCDDSADAPLWLAPQTPWQRMQAAYTTTWDQFMAVQRRLLHTLCGPADPAARGAWPRSRRWHKVVGTTLVGLLLSVPFQDAVVPPAHAAALAVNCTTADLIAKITTANSTVKYGCQVATFTV